MYYDPQADMGSGQQTLNRSVLNYPRRLTLTNGLQLNPHILGRCWAKVFNDKSLATRDHPRSST